MNNVVNVNFSNTHIPMYSSDITMTSVEIAEMLGCRHDNLKASIERLADRGVIRLPAMQDSEKINNLGFKQPYSYYVFSGKQGRIDSTIVVAQNSPEFCAQLVYRWDQLEEEKRNPYDIADYTRFETDPVYAIKEYTKQLEHHITQKRIAEIKTKESSDKTHRAKRIMDFLNTKSAKHSRLIMKMIDDAGYVREHIVNGKHMGYIVTDKGSDYFVEIPTKGNRRDIGILETFRPVLVEMLERDTFKTIH